MTIAIITLDARGLTLARKLAAALPDATTHRLAGRAPKGDECPSDIVFENAMDHLRAVFAAGTTIVGVCAAGILIRALGPHVSDKRRDPPVLAVSGDGAAIVPLIGGHHGANDLARRIEVITGGVAAITTASDGAFGFALDDPPDGWRIENPDQLKPTAAALLAGEAVSLTVECGSADWLGDEPWTKDAARTVRVTDRADAETETDLVLRPPVLALGVGCERNVGFDELRDLVHKTLRDANLSPNAVACVASIDLKSDEAAVLALAQELGRPARFFTAAELEAESPRLKTPSDIVFRETGCHGVSEGAALAAAGSDSELIVAKTKSARATCAIARATDNIDAHAVGQARGVLDVVGIGPGDAAWRTPDASHAIARADSVVGYSLYLDIVADIMKPGARVDSELGAEEDRVRHALDLAANGGRVALVSSGDAGIYALATLVFELLETSDDPRWNRIAINVIPGVSAMQAAAARAGAPLGHDFCAVSLSDLLTPRDVILQRLGAAASAGFVTALYNPQSRTRRILLDEARKIFMNARPADTPVVIARNLGRADESVTLTTLSDFDPGAVDMLTIVILGGADTKTIKRGATRWTYTPRGYGVTEGRKS
ncbi:MAG: precorrin-3B C(17)-methyltransferase [Rhodospirillaceae bacterium]|jgi:cobalt-precorrin 5A hydrolase / precorrin-3B C17-methyltransferase|nr:precorrin-3B C(17)-methyltransferase [Rhodospirillaceae bacterium]MBT5667435.1 precorrin-3B C(17)-methyltransferase [Rhodospirillaceae bacterium]MBT5810314.1 precorrin-3B C(17)-methyltransferase [Rhodospirillaceae bacterium]